jgi:hypothetical protein
MLIESSQDAGRAHVCCALAAVLIESYEVTRSGVGGASLSGRGLGVRVARGSP